MLSSNMTSSSPTPIIVLLLCTIIFGIAISSSDAFLPNGKVRFRQRRARTHIFDYKESESGSEDFWAGDGDLDAPSEAIDDLSWRVEKLRLEEANKRRFLKAGPRFLPYGECRKWVLAWGNRWETEEDWKAWIRQGEKRNAYIPARPDEYYGKLGKWISWNHFLGQEEV